MEEQNDRAYGFPDDMLLHLAQCVGSVLIKESMISEFRFSAMTSDGLHMLRIMVVDNAFYEEVVFPALKATGGERIQGEPGN